MKTRVLFVALLCLASLVATAQTPSVNTLATKARTARSVANDVRAGRLQKATASVLKDRDVQRHVKVDKDLQDKALDPNLKNKVRDAKRDARRDPVTFGEKSYKEIKKYKKYRPSWFRHKRKTKAGTKR